MATRADLEKALKVIDWRIANSGNGLNDFILNHEGKRTLFVMRGNVMRMRGEDRVFGDSFFGGIEFNLENLDVIVNEDKDAVNICDRTKKHTFVFAFYNFDKDKE